MKIKEIYILLVIIFLIGNFLFLIHIEDFSYLGSSNFSDIPITHYPNLLFIKNSILQYHQIPLWSDLIFSGYPFASNPLSGLWYFPGWIALLFPLPMGINITILLHLLLGMFGMFQFLKFLNISDKSALFGSIAFVFSNKIVAHIGAGHLSLIYAICWTPWFLFSLKNFEKTKWISKYLPSGLIFGVMLLADLRWSIPMTLIWLTYLLQLPQKLIEKIKSFFSILGIGLISSVAVWLPLLQLIQFTNRVHMTSSDRLVYSFSPIDMLNFLFPIFEGSAETRIYPGIVVIVLVVVGIPLIRKKKILKPWYFLVIISLLLSLGDNLPGINLVFNLPGFSLTRVPARFLFPLLFAASIISSIVLDKFFELSKKQDIKKAIFLLSTLGFFILLLALGGMILMGSFSFNFIWSSIILLVILVYLISILRIGANKKRFIILATVLLLIDLGLINKMSLTFKDTDEVLYDKNELINYLKVDDSLFRVYTPSYSISQEQGAYWGIKQVNGIDPIQLDIYVQFFQLASGVRSSEYSVTLPSFNSGNPDNDNAGICPSIPLLEDLNTKYVISSFPLENCGFENNPEIISGQYIYKTHGDGNYAKFLNCDNNIFQTSIERITPNEIILHVRSCSGILQISEIIFPGWRLFINNQEADFVSDALLRQIQLPKGEHTIKMVYQPKLVIFSAISQFIFWVFSLVLLAFFKKKEHEQALE